MSNTGARTLSSYAVSADGELRLAEAVAASTGDGSAPIDSALTRDARFLYVVDSALGRVLGYRTAGSQLAPAAEVDGLPASIQGIAAR